MAKESRGLENFVMVFFGTIMALLLGAVIIVSVMTIDEFQEQKPLNNYSGELLIVDRAAVSKADAIFPWDERYEIQGEAPGGLRQWFAVNKGDYYRLQGENFTCAEDGNILYSCPSP